MKKQSVGDVRPPSELSSGYGSTRSQKNKGAAAALAGQNGTPAGIALSSGATSLETQSSSGNQITSTHAGAAGEAVNQVSAQQQQLTGNAQQRPFQHQQNHNKFLHDAKEGVAASAVGGMTLKNKAPPAPPLPPPNSSSHSPALKPVNIVKPTTDEQQLLPGGPKTSTPIKANQSIQSFSYASDSTGFSPSGDPHAQNFNHPLQQQQHHSQHNNHNNHGNNSHAQLAPALPPPNEWATLLKRNGRNNQISHNRNGGTNSIANNSGKPLVDARLVYNHPHTNGHGMVPPVKLATVRPQRIASVSGGSYRPFRMPEAPRILFRSVRGKSTSASSLNFGGTESYWSAGGGMAAVIAGGMPIPDTNPQYLIPVISKNLSRSCKEVYQTQQDLSVDTNFMSNPAAPIYTNHTNSDNMMTVSQSLLPQNSDELEAITLANTIANKNANKISPVSSYSPNHHHYATISPPTTPGGNNVVMGTTALAKRAAAAAVAAASPSSSSITSSNSVASSVPTTTTTSHTSNGDSIGNNNNIRSKPPISTKPTSINSITMSAIPPPTTNKTNTANRSSGSKQRGIASSSTTQPLSSDSSSSMWKGDSVGNPKTEKKRKSSKRKERRSKSGKGGERGIEMSSIPPPLIGNKQIPPPPMLDDDDDEEETEALGCDNNKPLPSSTKRITMAEGCNTSDGAGSASNSNDDNNNLTVDEDDDDNDDDEEDDDVLGNDDEKQWLTTDSKKPRFYDSVKNTLQQPLAAPRIQVKNSKHVYQNIPFTKKTPLHEV